MWTERRCSCLDDALVTTLACVVLVPLMVVILAWVLAIELWRWRECVGATGAMLLERSDTGRCFEKVWRAPASRRGVPRGMHSNSTASVRRVR